MTRSPLFARPSATRGLIPLILGALAAGRAIYGAVNANQKKQRNKGYIDEAYRSAQQRQRVKEGDVRQGTAESLASRGLLTSGAVRRTTATPAAPVMVPGSRILNAMRGAQFENAKQGLAQSGAIVASRTLGQRAQNENSREFALERSDLTAARNAAQRENKAEGFQGQFNSIINGATGIASAIGLSQQLGAGAQLSQSATDAARSDQSDQIAALPIPGVQAIPPSRAIAGAMGIDNPNNWFGGIHGIRPLDAPGSSWNRKETLTGPGSPNYDFHL